MAAERNADLVAGALMAAASALTILAMAHHPSGAGHGAGALGPFIHGAMIILLVLIFFGFSHFSLRRGRGDSFVLAALISYGVSVGAHVGAATINGFVVPALAAREAPHDLFLLCWEGNQALARLGVYATSVAFILWSAHLILTPRTLDRLLALAGLASGAFAIWALASGFLKMDVSGAIVVYSAHAAFSFLVGVRLATGGFRKRVTLGGSF